MNKKLLRVALLVAVVAVAGLGVHKAQAKKPVLSDIMLANVEALSSGEFLCPDCMVCTGIYHVCVSRYDAFWNDLIRNCSGFDGILHLERC